MVVSASPYGDPSLIERAALSLRDSGAQFVCLDCMGFTQHMKTLVGKASGLPVLLPRTLTACVAAEILSDIERKPGEI